MTHVSQAGTTRQYTFGQSAAAPARSVVQVRNAVKIYGDAQTRVTALNDVSVDFPQGQLTAIMGPSGSGKSTLMHCAAGLDALTSGQVFIADAELSGLSDKQLTLLRRERVGFVFQSFNLVPTLTALENICLPATLAGKKPDADWLAKVVATVRLEDRLKHRPTELSGGQQQRVAVARALVTQPDVIFADEPTGNLDSSSGAEILRFLQSAARDFGQTIVMVTHDAIAASYADSVMFLKDGMIVDHLDGPTAESVLDRMKALEGR